jgi:DNA-binding IclR family transcriptional regulator
MLAALTDDEVKAIYPAARLEQVTARTHATRRALLDELAQIRERGYAVNIGESEDGLVAIAAAIRDEAGTPRGAFTVAAPETRLGPTAQDGVGVVVSDAADRAAATLR